MATATGKPTPPSAISPEITHPLDQLRGTIRRYVVVEGLLAARYGYSAEMIVQTIAEARERVAKVPVNEVFNWRRLRTMASVLGGTLAGALAVGYVAYVVGAGSLNPYKFGWRAAHVVGIFLE